MPDGKEKVANADPSRIITASNGLSLLRAFLALPIIYFLAIDELAWCVALIITAVLTDFFDGHFARRAHTVTNLGRVLDPTADGILMLSVALFMALDESRGFPLWFLIFYIVRYFSIALISIYVMNHYSVVLSSNWLGKRTIVVSALAVFLYVIKIGSAGLYILLVATVLAVISWYQYLANAISFLKK